MGYCLTREAWGRGIATEAARRLRDFGFDTLGAHRIRALADIENEASIRVLKKLGMLYEGHNREDELIRGEWRSAYVYAILETDPRP